MPAEAQLGAAFLLGLAGALATTPLALRVAQRTSFYDHPQRYKAHARATPYLGGAAVTVAFLAGSLPVVGRLDALWAVALGLIVLWAIGTVDDRRTVPPAPRLFVTAAAATLLWSVDLGWSVLPSDAANLGLKWLWVIGIVNAFNLMDNMDGAAAVVAAVCMGGIGAFALVQGGVGVAGIAFAMCGACLGFLPYNVTSPARIFLGDGGSMAIGFVVAAAVMALPWDGGATTLVPAVLLVALPIFDTALVVVSRYRRGATIWAGSRDHVTHRIFRKLRSTRRVAVVLALVQVALSLGALAVFNADRTALAATGLLLVALMVIGGIVLEGGFWTAGIPSPTPVSGAPREERVRVLRVITRMNVGGPAYHVSLLSGRLDPERYETLLVCGEVGPGEASFEHLAEKYGVRLEKVPTLGPEISPLADLRALVSLVRIVRRFRPDLVHTHTAKAGMLGRLAAAFAVRPRPVILHTYHGHVLEGYFGKVQTSVYRWIERALARVSDCLVGVSQATVDDLVRLGVAPRNKFRVVPLGLDLRRFLNVDGELRSRFRREVGADPDDLLLTYVGRLVPIKRLDVMLQGVARARRSGAPVRLAVVGDGVLRPSLEQLTDDLDLNGHVRFLGYRDDLEAILAGADAAVLTSDNEGTPVSLIEAAAAGRPAIATAVGGVRDVVSPDTGFLVGAGDNGAFAEAVCRLGADETLRREMGGRVRERVYRRFSADRLLADVAALYEALLGPARDGKSPSPSGN